MEKIKAAAEDVLAFLRNVPLSDSSIEQYKVHLFGGIVPFCEANGIEDFSDTVMLVYIEGQMSKAKQGELTVDYVVHRRKAAALLADCMQGRELVWGRKNYRQKKLCGYFESVLVGYDANILQRLARYTRQGHICIIRQFLAFLEQNGIHGFEKLSAKDVKGFVITMVPNRKSSMEQVTSAIKKFVLYITETGIASVNAEQCLLAPAPRNKKLLPCLTDLEVEAVIRSLDRSTPIGKRDYAIIMLALWTGLRRVDILSLKRSDIDWNRNAINVVQEKTDVGIQTELSPSVGNAIADYILNGRPETDAPYIFVRHLKPYGRLSNTAANDLMSRALQKSGIPHEAWDGKSFHAFRRTFGTRLVRAGVPVRSVGEMLGHTNPNSAKRYVALDIDGLRTCCMDISMFSTKKASLI